MSRTERIANLLKKEIAEILHRKVNDSRIGFISITRLEVSKDLAHAWVHYSQFGDDITKATTRKGLASATPFIKLEIGKILTTQTVPNLHFKYDDSLEHAQKMSDRIDELSQL